MGHNDDEFGELGCMADLVHEGDYSGDEGAVDLIDRAVNVRV